MSQTDGSVQEEVVAWKTARGANELFIRAANRNGANVNAWQYWIEVDGVTWQIRISRDNEQAR